MRFQLSPKEHSFFFCFVLFSKRKTDHTRKHGHRYVNCLDKLFWMYMYLYGFFWAFFLPENCLYPPNILCFHHLTMFPAIMNAFPCPKFFFFSLVIFFCLSVDLQPSVAIELLMFGWQIKLGNCYARCYCRTISNSCSPVIIWSQTPIKNKSWKYKKKY